ncbi:MAG: serine/threonine protein kinase, partial [Candidatus Eisenbacteria bacterium]|nr:serine/threonine protein kinase [Candidatus Eisenbacteria bacterium]
MAEETIGPYRILAPVGDSGQALSYRAVHTRLDRQVFLKVLPSGGPGWAERRSRFEREAKALAKIDHPAVVRVYDCGEDEGRLYLASEYVEGHDLARRLAAGPLPWEELLPLARTLLEGLEALHTAGIIHRDIKPSNIMLSVKGPKLADLGLARLVQSPAATQSDTLVGTPAYMDPETLRGGTADARSDLFSLGATLFEALAGRRAFPGETFQEAVRGLLESDPIASLPADVPEEARGFLAALLEKRPEQRPQDVASARELLRPSASASRQLPRRHRAAVWLPAVFVMAGVTALTVVFTRPRLRPTRETAVTPVVV